MAANSNGIAYKQTSADAWETFAPASGTLDHAILSLLDAAGRAGLTDYEIETRLNRSHQAVSGNRRHLVERGVVKKTILRGVTQSGRQAIRWVHARHWDEAVHEAGVKTQKVLF